MKKEALLAVALVSSASHAKPARSEWNAAEARKGMEKFGRCIVNAEPSLSRDYVLTSTAWPVGPDDILDRCLAVTEGSGTLRFPEAALKYTLASVLFQRDYAAGMPSILNRRLPIVAKLPPTAQELNWRADPRKVTEVAEADARSAAADTLAGVAKCVVTTDPISSYGLLMSAPATDAEHKKLQPIIALLPKCINSATRISVDPISLRGTMAVTFYRLANAPAE